MGIAILGVCLLHAFKWAGIGESLIAHTIGPFARIAFTDGFLPLRMIRFAPFSPSAALCCTALDSVSFFNEIPCLSSIYYLLFD